MTVLQPDGWAKPRGYSNGIAARGTVVSIAGQIGWNAACAFESDDFAAAMTAVQVVALIEDRARVEIEATAVIPD